MKKILTVFLAILLIFTFSACGFNFRWQAKGTNIKVYSEDDATVYFYPVCPDCGHVSPMYSVNLSEGEEHETIHQCESCYHTYDIEITR